MWESGWNSLSPARRSWSAIKPGWADFPGCRRQPLCLALRPILPGWLFTQEGRVSFRFLGQCTVTYHNPRRLDTFRPGVAPQRTQLFDAQGKLLFSATGNNLDGPYAAWVREGKVARIEVFYA